MKEKAILIIMIAVIFVNVPLTHAQLPLDGVVSYWPFDEGTIAGNTVEDVLGDNAGELDGNPKQVDGKVGKALEFNSPVKGVVAGCCGTIVAQRDINGWALRFDGRNAGQEMEFIVTPGWQGDGGFGAPTFKKGEWHHIVGVVNKKQMLLYVDGEVEKEMVYNGPMTTDGSETEIGRASDGGFVGIIDEVMIYNKALSADDVSQIFEAEGLLVEPAAKLATRWGEIKSLK